MSQKRKPRGVRATQEGLQKLQQAKAAGRDEDGKPLTYEQIAEKARVDKKTVERFFRGEGKDRDYAIAIVQALGLEITEIVDPNDLNPPVQTFDEINWHEVCSKVLAQQQEKQLFRRSITGRRLGHEAKNVYVKLGLIKPKEEPQSSAARGMLQYGLIEKEIEQEYKYEEFLKQVIDGKEKNFAIVGEPGAGKSTWLEQISLYVNQFTVSLVEPSGKGFPICISLASLAGKTLEDYLLQIWLEDALPFIPNTLEITPALKNQLKELFNSGKAWLLLDGVDEMGGQINSAPLQTIANQLRGWVDQARVILTCRLNVWEANPNALPNFETYHTLHFDDEQVGDFIGQWFTQEGKPESGEKLQNKLGESGNDRIRDLIKNPLRLAMLCGIWYFHQGDLPKTKAALYQRYIDYFYQWKPHPLLTDDLDKQEELHTAFSQLALAAIDEKLPLRKKFVHKIMGQSLFQLARDVGWLNWVYKDAETGEDVYAFFHFTFQEYFAACGIEDWDYFLPREHKDKPVEDKDNPGKYKPYRIFELQWKEVILLWLGREDVEKEEKEEFIKMLVGFEDGCGDFYHYRAYFLAAAGIVEYRNCGIADEIVSQIVEWAFSDRKFLEVHVGAARAALQETDRKKAVFVVTQLLHCCEDDWTRFQLAGNLWRIDSVNPDAKGTFINLLSSDKDEYIRLATTIFLLEKNIDYLEAIKCLFHILATTENQIIFQAVTLQLDQLHDSDSETTNNFTRKQQIVQAVQIEQMYTVASYENIENTRTLIEIMCTTPDEEIRQKISEYLKLNFGGELLPQLVTALKAYLTVQEGNDVNLCQNCYQVIWHCTKNMTYLTFYEAWHS